MEGLTVGRIVHFVLRDGPCAGQCRPAIVVKVLDAEAGVCSMQVFTDAKDGVAYIEGIVWRSSIYYDETKAGGTWHWPERA